MKSLSKAATALPRSGIREVMELAAQLTDVIHLEVGEPDQGTPPHVIEAAHRAAKAGFTGYTPNAGLTSLREVVAEAASHQMKIPWSAQNVVITPGAVSAIFSSILAVIDPGDEVLIPNPGWPNYASAVLMARGRPIGYPLLPSRGFQPDCGTLERLITPHTKLIITNSPANPTGAVFSADTAANLMKLAEQHDLYVISDEIYERFVYGLDEHVSLAGLDGGGRVITVNGVSKTYAMTGWRIGYTLSSETIASVVAKLQEPQVSCASSISQKAAEAAISGPQQFVSDIAAAYKKRRDLVVRIMEGGGLVVPPDGAFYALIDISTSGKSSAEYSKTLLQDFGVAVAPGRTFGSQSERMVRISFATDAALLEEGLKRIKESLSV